MLRARQPDSSGSASGTWSCTVFSNRNILTVYEQSCRMSGLHRALHKFELDVTHFNGYSRAMIHICTSTAYFFLLSSSCLECFFHLSIVSVGPCSTLSLFSGFSIPKVFKSWDPAWPFKCNSICQMMMNDSPYLCQLLMSKFFQNFTIAYQKCHSIYEMWVATSRRMEARCVEPLILLTSVFFFFSFALYI